MDTYRKHWDENSLPAKASLLFASYRGFRERAEANGITAAYAALSSTCYSIAGTAIATLKRHARPGLKMLLLPLDLVTWVPLGAWCYWRMLPLSDTMLAKAYDGYGSPYDNLIADQCDVRQSILRRRGRWEEAERCIDAGLHKNPQGHTLGLLLIGKAACVARKDDSSSRELVGYAQRIKRIAIEIRETEPRQAIRLYRGVSEILWTVEGYRSEAICAMIAAHTLAGSIGAKDQIAKL